MSNEQSEMVVSPGWIKFPTPDDPLSPQEQLMQIAHQGNRCAQCKGPLTQRDAMRLYAGNGLICNKCIWEVEGVMKAEREEG